MRASRLLHMLLLLQNRGRLTCGQLAKELEVTRRTIMRDVDALTEAGLPIIMHQGNRGGVELGFNYRTRLTGLAADEAEAMAVILMKPTPELEALGLAQAGERARSKMLESFPDGVRERITEARARFRFTEKRKADMDPRVTALANAIRRRSIVRVRAYSESPRIIHPTALIRCDDQWSIVDALDPANPIPIDDCADINVSARRF